MIIGIGIGTSFPNKGGGLPYPGTGRAYVYFTDGEGRHQLVNFTDSNGLIWATTSEVAS